MNGIYVAAEFALVTASRPKLKSMADHGSNTAERILEIISNPELQNRYITTAQVGITIASLGLGMYGEHAFADWLLAPLHHFEQLSESLAHTIASILSVSLLTYLHVVLGEMIPKSFALQTASDVVTALYIPLNISDKIFSPIVFLMNKASFAMINATGITDQDQRSRLFNSGDIEFAVEESHASGMLEYSDQLFIENILDIDERKAKQVMTPRNQINAIPINTNPEEIHAIICRTNNTRYPVYNRTLDDIQGTLHLKDLTRFQVDNNALPEDIQPLLRPTLYIPESLPLNVLLAKFKQNQTQLAIVLDEFGGTAGVITFEDLIEEVVGEIQDEFDIEVPPIQKISENTYRVKGDVILGELEQHLHIRLPQQVESNTIGGYVMTELGTIPRINDAIHLPGVSIVVESVQQRAVEFLKIKLV
jgi:CBS domain containing-hemolysin-like protein